MIIYDLQLLFKKCDFLSNQLRTALNRCSNFPYFFNAMLSILMRNNSKYFLEGGIKLAFAVSLTY